LLLFFITEEFSWRTLLSQPFVFSWTDSYLQVLEAGFCLFVLGPNSLIGVGW
jgi:hypothetical protein